MQFSYKLTQAEFQKACKIKLPTDPSARTHWTVLWVLFYLFILACLAVGMLFGWSQVRPLNAAPIAKIVTAALIAAAPLYWIAVSVFRWCFLWTVARQRGKRFEDDPGCRTETTVEVSSEAISFRCETCSSRCAWKCFSAWAESGELAVLLKRSGLRQIVKLANLSDQDREQFRSLLNKSIGA